MEIISRADAIKRGLKRYFPGTPCKHGHIAEYFVHGGNCSACRKIFEAKRFKSDPKRREGNRRWRLNNPERASELTRDWCAKNKERSKRIKLKYASRPEVKERRRGWFKEYRQRPESKPLAQQHKRTRRAREVLAIGSHTPQDIVDIFRMQSGKCAYCKCELIADRHVDHIQPLSLGGSNNRSNLQILCVSCNLTKHAKDPLVFAREIGLLL